MIYLQVSIFWLLAATVFGDLPRGTKRNTYLPPEPTKGYSYEKPPIPFPKPTPGYPTRPSSFPTEPSRPTGPFPKPTKPGFPVTPSRPYPGPGTKPTSFPSPRPTPYPSPRPRPTPGVTDYPGQPDNGHDHHHHHEPGMPFDFNYAVKEDAFGNDYSHNAISDGDIVRGEYRVQLPDGRTQIVRYTADWKHGFSAQVSYDGTPRFDLSRPSGNFNGY